MVVIETHGFITEIVFMEEDINKKTEQLTEHVCPYCQVKFVDNGVWSVIIQRGGKGKILKTNMRFCSGEHAGYYQMGCEG